MHAPKEELIRQVVRVANYLAEKYRLNMSSADSKRETDIMFLSIWGERSTVLKVPFDMLEHLRDVDIEFVQSGRRGGDYLLLLVITRKIINQPIRNPERRAKLQGRRFYNSSNARSKNYRNM